MGTVKLWLNDLLSLFVPPLCHVCGTRLVEGERFACLKCFLEMPRTNYHLLENSPMHYKLLCHAPIEKTAAMFFYVKGTNYAKLIQDSKYNDLPQIDRWLASTFAEELKHSGFFNSINLILPVPMSGWKKFRRGFNQAEVIAEGVNEITGIPLGDNLFAQKGHKTQTRKSAIERQKNAENVFSLRYSDELAGKHVLLVDDVITTGATLRACCEVIHNGSPSTRISVLTLASTPRF